MASSNSASVGSFSLLAFTAKISGLVGIAAILGLARGIQCAAASHSFAPAWCTRRFTSPHDHLAGVTVRATFRDRTSPRGEGRRKARSWVLGCPLPSERPPRSHIQIREGARGWGDGDLRLQVPVRLLRPGPAL